MKCLTFPLLCASTTSMALAGELSAPKFEAQTIDPAIAIGYGLAIGDVDGDKKADVLLADAREIVWYHNPDWKKTVIAKSLTVQDNVCIAAQDLDGDGKVEIAVGANWNPGETTDDKKSGSVHYLIRPAAEGELWKPVTLPNEPTVHRMRWVRQADNTWALVVLPLHGRENKGGAGPKGVKIMAYLPPKDPSDAAAWKTTVIDDSLHVTHNFDQRADKDGDALFIGGKEAILFAKATSGGVWAKERMKFTEVSADTPQFPGVGEVRLHHGADAASYNLASIEPFHGQNLCFYGWNKETRTWKREVIESAFNEGHALGCGNFLGGTEDQIVAGWRNPNAEKKVGLKIYWRAADGKWTSAWVDENKMACEDLKVADLNGDGKLDVIAAGRATKNVVVYWNRSGG